MRKEEASLKSFLLQVGTIAIAIASFALLYDAILDRMEGKSDSVLSSLVSKAKSAGVMLASVQTGDVSTNAEVHYERYGNELVVDLRGICTKVDVVSSGENEVVIECANGKTVKIGEKCEKIKDWKMRNGVLTVMC